MLDTSLLWSSRQRDFLLSLATSPRTTTGGWWWRRQARPSTSRYVKAPAMSATASSERIFRPTIRCATATAGGSSRSTPNTTGSPPAAWATAHAPPSAATTCEHITHGYAITVHASQGTTAHSTHAVLGDNTSRATLYVAMTPARESNTAYLCERTAGEGARVDLAGWDLWVSGKAEAMSDEKSASPVWCRVGARCDHRGKRSCW